jgi:hypothetical protein
MWPGTSESGRSLLRESGGEKLSLERGDLSIDLEGREVLFVVKSCSFLRRSSICCYS